MKDFSNKVVVITGSASGIGFALARQLAKQGARVVVTDRNEERTAMAVDRLHAEDLACVGHPCDVTSREEVEQLARFAIDEYGCVDVLINNAGIGQAPARLLDMDLAKFQRVLDVNLYGVIHGIQVFGKLFEEQGQPAAIYNLGSENSLYPCVPLSHAYVASKHAVLAITELLAEEVPDWIDVAVIMPGLVETELTAGVFSGMNVDEFAERVIEQLKAGQRYVVSHAYNRVRLDERHASIGAAYDKYAPRYDGDEEYDIRTLISKMG